MNNSDTIEARWILGLIPPEELPDAAQTLLNCGVDGDSLFELTNSRGADSSVLTGLFKIWLSSVGRGAMSKREAMRVYTRDVSKQISQGHIEPYAGARDIWDVSLILNDTEFHEVDAFIYAASEYEDRPSDRSSFEKEIVKEASRWVERPTRP
jgi:hypothetical protein